MNPSPYFLEAVFLSSHTTQTNPCVTLSPDLYFGSKVIIGYIPHGKSGITMSCRNMPCTLHKSMRSFGIFNGAVVPKSIPPHSWDGILQLSSWQTANPQGWHSLGHPCSNIPHPGRRFQAGTDGTSQTAGKGFNPQKFTPRCVAAHVFGGDTWGPRPSATSSPHLLRLPKGLAVPFDVQMNHPGQEKPRGFMNSSSMMSFQSYPPEEHLLSPSSPAPPSQAFLSPPPSQAWGAMLLPRSKIPSANRATCQPPCSIFQQVWNMHRSRPQPHGKELRARDEILQFNLLPAQIMPALQFQSS